MAELQRNIRRVGGGLDTPKRPFGRRLLLPTEVELCKLLNLSEDEYWYFVEETESYNGERKEGYELIPNIRCDPATALITVGSWSLTWGQVYLQIALLAVGYLLSPKPKPIKAGETRRTPDSIGAKKFAPQHSFNSVQELATLGDIVPLVFANQTEEAVGNAGKVNYTGGVRVNGQLLWSQLLSLGNSQQFKAMALFSLGEIDRAINYTTEKPTNPDFNGFAIGDLLLSSYTRKKLDLFFKSSPRGTANNRISIDDKYSESGLVGMDYPFLDDVFSDRCPISKRRDNAQQLWPFSGARNPTTQAIFGAYSPMPNANVVKLNYQLSFPVKGTDDPAKRSVATLQKKIGAFWPTRAGFSGADAGELTVEDNLLTYTILENSQQNVDNQVDGYKPHGVEDVVSMVQAIRERTDQNLSVGETFLAGDAVVSCTDVETLTGQDGVPWRPDFKVDNEPEVSGIRRVYHFRVDETGSNYEGYATGSLVCNPGTGGLDKHAANPQWQDKTTHVAKADMKLHQKVGLEAYDDTTKYGFAYRNPILQKVALGTITNNRACSQTEIGLKSRVFGQIRGANLNTQPVSAELNRLYKNKVQFQLGQIDQYIKRFSFFYLQMRVAGSDGEWETLQNTSPNHTGLFCVRGSTPEYQYNFIRISHPNPFTQFEYRFKPYPGNNIPILHLDQKVNLLNAQVTHTEKKDEESEYKVDRNFDIELSFGHCNVSFKGFDEFVLSRNEICNTEWKISYNTGEVLGGMSGGAVTEMDREHAGTNVKEIPKANLTTSEAAIAHHQASLPSNAAEIADAYQYSYDVSDGKKDITLISLNQDHLADGGSTWAWIAYKNGEVVGVTPVPAGTPSTDIVIQGNNGMTYTPDVHPTVTNHPEAPIDPATGQPEVMPVHYYTMNESPDTTAPL